MRKRILRRLALAAAALATTAGVAAIPPSSASAQTSVNQLLVSAAKTESAAYLQYYAYATYADRTGDSNVANVWRTVARVEHQDHWTHEETLGNFYSGSDNVTNLQTAINQARQLASDDNSRAAEDPRSKAAQALRTIEAREDTDTALLSQALNAEQGTGTIPTAPTVTKVSVTESQQPKYSGTFYNDLTSGNNSALEGSAWLWAEYQFMGKTAVDTGQARLAGLLMGLSRQEQLQNYPQISNAAGYVNGNLTNLESSISSEQGAVVMYADYSKQARSDGHPSLAATFISIRGDETGHRRSFTDELHKLDGFRG